ncbi:MAG: DUF1972 domain-containing protein [Chitinophagales bacterium]|nr:DUF1972 domain-containing protein [Chitinophagales bacterium]
MRNYTLNKKKVGLIGTVGVPARYGGFETLAHHLVLNWSSQFDTIVYCSSKAYPEKDRPTHWNGARLVYWPFKANGVQSIIYDILSIIHALLYVDVLLILGVSGCIFLPLVKIFSSKRIIVNIDGLEWRRAKWNTWIKHFLIFSERMAIRYADEIITDNEAIQEYVKDEYGIFAKMIAYGGNHAKPVIIENETLEQYPFLDKSYAFKVCRIEPENNIKLILEAFKEMSDFPLVIVGNWSHSLYGRGLVKEFGHIPHLHLLDPIYNQNILNQLRSNCTLYVHGHSAGGTNPSLVEAMNLGLPILAYDVIYNRKTTHEKALYFKTQEELFYTLQQLPSRRLRQIAQNMKELADEHYTWEIITDRYVSLAGESVLKPVPSFLLFK